MPSGAGRIAAQRTREVAKKKKSVALKRKQEQIELSKDGRLDTGSLLYEFKALTDELDLDSDEQVGPPSIDTCELAPRRSIVPCVSSDADA